MPDAVGLLLCAAELAPADDGKTAKHVAAATPGAVTARADADAAGADADLAGAHAAPEAAPAAAAASQGGAEPAAAVAVAAPAADAAALAPGAEPCRSISAGGLRVACMSATGVEPAHGCSVFTHLSASRDVDAAFGQVQRIVVRALRHAPGTAATGDDDAALERGDGADREDGDGMFPAPPGTASAVVARQYQTLIEVCELDVFVAFWRTSIGADAAPFTGDEEQVRAAGGAACVLAGCRA